VTVDLTEQSLNGACCFGWPSVMLFSSAGIWYIYLCDHSDRCNLTLVKKSTCSVIWPSKVQFFLPCWCMMKLQGKGKDWQEGQGDEACRFIYFESITGSCSKKEGISFVFVKYSNVNAILFVLLKCQCWYQKYQLCVCQILKCLWGFFSRAHVCEAEIYPFFLGGMSLAKWDKRWYQVPGVSRASGANSWCRQPGIHCSFRVPLWCAATCQVPLNTRECLVGEKIWVWVL
jgi:hypothetical protein